MLRQLKFIARLYQNKLVNQRWPFKSQQSICKMYCTANKFSQSEHDEGHKKHDDATEERQQQKKKTPKIFVPATRNPFATASEKTKDVYLSMVNIFTERDVHRRNHVEFIYAAMKHMSEFGVDHDLDVYKALINVMPKGKMIPRNVFQAEFMHYPKQQQCIIDLLEQMEDLGVMPDYEMEAMLLNIFGRHGHPLRKYWRMMYWMPKFKNLSPFPLPNPVPDDTLTVAKLAVQRMCTVDSRSQISIFDTKDVEHALDKTWIVNGMSCDQAQLLKEHPRNKALYIEGPFLIWLRNKTINYFTLRADPDVEFLKIFKNHVEDEDGKCRF